MSGFVLTALRESLLLWKNSTDFVLKDEDWHVTEYYDNIRRRITTDYKDKAVMACAQMKLPESFCQVPIQARTEFTPRYDPANKNIRSLFKATRSPMPLSPSLYDPPDVYIPDLHPPAGAIDVLAIVESGVAFVPNLGRIRRRISLTPANVEVVQGGSSANPKLVPGKGWYHDQSTGTNMCDGEYDSWCKRGNEQSCLLYAHNDNRGGLMFDGLSGWGIFELPNVKEGLIALKFHDWLAPNSIVTTNGWKTENNEPSVDARALGVIEEGQRDMKKGPPDFCPEFKFEFAIDGKVTIWDAAMFKEQEKLVERVVQVATVLNDPNYTGGEPKTVELAVRMTGCQRLKAFSLTHIYWA